MKAIRFVTVAIAMLVLLACASSASADYDIDVNSGIGRLGFDDNGAGTWCAASSQAMFGAGYLSNAMNGGNVSILTFACQQSPNGGEPGTIYFNSWPVSGSGSLDLYAQTSVVAPRIQSGGNLYVHAPAVTYLEDGGELTSGALLTIDGHINVTGSAQVGSSAYPGSVGGNVTGTGSFTAAGRGLSIGGTIGSADSPLGRLSGTIFLQGQSVFANAYDVDSLTLENNATVGGNVSLDNVHGPGSVTIPSSATAAVLTGSAGYPGPLGGLTVNRAFTMNNASFKSAGAVSFNGPVSFVGSNDINATGSTITFADTTTIGAAGSAYARTTGAVSQAGTVDGAGDLALTGGTISLTGAMGGTTPLRSVYMTGATTLDTSLSASSASFSGSGLTTTASPHTITVGGNGLTVNAPLHVNGALRLALSGSSSLTKPVDGAGSVTKAGPGALSITAASPAAPPLTLADGGSVRVTGTWGGAMTIDDGTLDGNGIIGGAVASSGAIRPGFGGASTATLTVGGYIANASSTLAADVGTYASDKLVVNGAVHLAGGALATAFSGALPIGVSTILVDNDGADAVVGTFSGHAEGDVVDTGFGLYRISYVGGSGNDVSITRVGRVTGAVTATVPAAAFVGDAVSVPVTVTGSGAGGTPTGTVQLLDGGTPIGAPVTLAGGAATLSSSTLAAGVHTLTVSYSGNDDYLSGSSPDGLVTVSRRTQSTLMANASPTSIAIGETSTLGATGGSGSGAVSYAVTAGETFCSVTDNTLTGTGVGTCTMTATKAADTQFAAATATVDVTVGKADQAMLMVSAMPDSIVMDGESALSTTGGSGSGAVTFAVTAGATSCSISGSTLTGIGVGACDVTATKAADDNFNATTSTVQVSVTPKADLQLAKDANRATAQVGEAVVYSLVVANAGPNDVSAAALSDTPPATLGGVEWACVASASSVPCPVAPNDAGSGALNVSFDLAAGQHLRYDLSATVQAVVGAQIQNTANVSAPNGVFDPNLANNAGTSTILVVPLGIFVDGFETRVSGKLSLPAAEKARERRKWGER